MIDSFRKGGRADYLSAKNKYEKGLVEERETAFGDKSKQVKSVVKFVSKAVPSNKGVKKYRQLGFEVTKK